MRSGATIDLQASGQTTVAPNLMVENTRATATTVVSVQLSGGDQLYLPAIAIETNGLGKFLPALLRREIHARRLGCPVIERVSSASKGQRILAAFDPLLAAAALRAHASIWTTPFIEEMREWRPGRQCRDDGLDAVSGCLLTEPVRLRRINPGPPRNWRPGQGPHVAASNFSP